MGFALLHVVFTINAFHMATGNPISSYRFDVNPVEKCPMNASEFETAAKRKKCTGNDRYLCAPDRNLSNLTEFCTDTKRSLFEKGNCVRLEGTGDLNHYRCVERFVSGCPTEPYTDDEIYKYPACLELNIDFKCFVADKDCRERLSTTTENYFNNSKNKDAIEKTKPEKYGGPIKLQIVIVIVYGFFYFAIIIGSVYHCKKGLPSENEKEEYEYFWDKKSVFSQSYPCTFVIGDNTFNCAEQYMMYQKAGGGQKNYVQQENLRSLEEKKTMCYRSLSGEIIGDISLKGLKTISDVRETLAVKLDVSRDTLYVVNEDLGVLLEDNKEMRDLFADTLRLMIVLDENRMKQTDDGDSTDDDSEDNDDTDHDCYEDLDNNDEEYEELSTVDSKCKHKGSWFCWTRQQLLVMRFCSVKCQVCSSTLKFDEIVKRCKMTPDEQIFFQTVLSLNKLNLLRSRQLEITGS